MDRLRLRRVAVCLSAAMMLSGSILGINAQITQIRAIDIGAAIASGDARVTVLPATGVDSTKPFDGNPFTEMALLTSDSMSITLEFKKAVRLEKSKVFFWGSGSWRMEGADTVSEFATHTGGYAMLVAQNACPAFQWDSVMFTRHDVRCVRLTASTDPGAGLYLGEWTLEGTVTFTTFEILPSQLRVIPGASLQLKVRIKDDQGKVYPNFLTEPLDWGSVNPSIATADPNGLVTGKVVGSTTVTVRTDGNTISGSAPLSVVDDFRGEKVAPMTIKVAVVYQDPTLENSNSLHEEFHWRDPHLLTAALIKHFREATDSVVNFQIVETVEATRLFTRLRGSYMSVTDYVALLKETGWKTLKAASDSGLLAFDYREFVKYYNFDTKRNSGQIDEVWVFAAPYLAMYESQLMGPKAFWWNSPAIKDGTALTKLLSVMGLNYERGVDQAFHSFGHRMESAMIQAYQDAQGRSWDPKSSDPTPWDLFTRIDKDMPDQAHVGNVHFPPNGTSDYNYGNTTLVTSYAENWYRYPYLFNQHSAVNVQTWYYTPGEPLAEGLDHLGYLRWWYGHIPRYVGVTDGVLNNWWAYATDYEAATERAQVISSVERERVSADPMTYRLEQNYPNPFNPTTTVEFSLTTRSSVTLEVFNVLGQNVATLVRGVLDAGVHRVPFDGRALSSGTYFYRLTTPSGVQTRKMLVIR
jgi:hypothetical protein